uniref:Uncharacterized protein n=1 Tax=Kalanchoe fedtschenkoi TaxID=63787 RepID=A0A7N0T883_KALFE
MVFSSMAVVSVARASADAWQVLACLPERLSSDQLLDLVICFPLQRMSRLALCIWTVFCFSPYPSSYPRYYPADSSSSSDSSSTSDDDEYRYYYYSGLHSD